MDNGDKRELYNGFGDSLARAVEFVAVPAVFGFLGHVLDDAVGTASLFTVVFVVFALAGTFVRSYFAYEAAMREHEARLPWRRPGAAVNLSVGTTPVRVDGGSGEAAPGGVGGLAGG